MEEAIRSEFKGQILNFSSEKNEFSMTIKREKFYEILSFLKERGFVHLSSITCVDYLEEGEFELVYHLWSYKKKERAEVKTRILRESPSIKSIIDLWPNAEMHERENFEMFGIKFKGNPNLSPLFLEDWKEIPPLRKDFNTRKFVKEEYYGKSGE